MWTSKRSQNKALFTAFLCFLFLDYTPIIHKPNSKTEWAINKSVLCSTAGRWLCAAAVPLGLCCCYLSSVLIALGSTLLFPRIGVDVSLSLCCCALGLVPLALGSVPMVKLPRYHEAKIFYGFQKSKINRAWDVPVRTPVYPSASWTGNGCMSWSAQIPAYSTNHSLLDCRFGPILVPTQLLPPIRIPISICISMFIPIFVSISMHIPIPGLPQLQARLSHMYWWKVCSVWRW